MIAVLLQLSDLYDVQTTGPETLFVGSGDGGLDAFTCSSVKCRDAVEQEQVQQIISLLLLTVFRLFTENSPGCVNEERAAASSSSPC